MSFKKSKLSHPPPSIPVHKYFATNLIYSINNILDDTNNVIIVELMHNMRNIYYIYLHVTINFIKIIHIIYNNFLMLFIKYFKYLIF